MVDNHGKVRKLPMAGRPTWKVWNRRVPGKGPGSTSASRFRLSEPRYHGNAGIAFLASVRLSPAADRMSSRSLVHLRSTWYHKHAGQTAICSACVLHAKADNPRSISQPSAKGSFDEALGNSRQPTRDRVERSHTALEAAVHADVVVAKPELIKLPQGAAIRLR